MGRRLEICILARELLQQSGRVAIGMERSTTTSIEELSISTTIATRADVKIDSVMLDLFHIERQFIYYWVSSNSGARMLEFKFWLRHLLAVWLNTNCLSVLYLYFLICVMGIMTLTISYFTRLLWGLNDLIYIKHLK